MYNCTEAAQRLYEYIDRELSDYELEEVEEHLQRCPPCRDVFIFEENVLKIVGECARRVTAPEDLVRRVRALSSDDSV